jgi:UPF0755 protein
MQELNNSNQAVEPPKPARKKGVVFFALGTLVILILGISSAVFAYWEMYRPLDLSDIAQNNFIVKKGEGVKEIAAALENEKLIRSAFWFETYVWLKKQSANLQAGEYSISKSFSAADIVSLMTGGKVVSNETQITFPEGFALLQIKERLQEKGFNVDDQLNGKKAGDFQLQYKFLNGVPENADLEGFLFPDTYRFHKDAKAEDIIKKFLDNFDKKLTPDMRQKISVQDKNLYNVIILASIVQQEAIGEQEMPLIAGVFANRLQIGMALQSDATVNYVTGKKDRQPTWGDTKVQSPYNTYLYKGLPPGPICNPGVAAIEAAISPQSTDYLYFLHPLDNPTVFSKTLDEHNRNKVKWLK